MKQVIKTLDQLDTPSVQIVLAFYFPSPVLDSSCSPVTCDVDEKDDAGLSFPRGPGGREDDVRTCRGDGHRQGRSDRSPSPFVGSVY